MADPRRGGRSLTPDAYERVSQAVRWVEAHAGQVLDRPAGVRPTDELVFVRITGPGDAAGLHPCEVIYWDDSEEDWVETGVTGRAHWADFSPASEGEYYARPVTSTPAGSGAYEDHYLLVAGVGVAELDVVTCVSPIYADEAGGSDCCYTDAMAIAAVEGVLASSITVTWTASPTSIQASVVSQMSVTADASGLMLVADQASPGLGKYYGTDGAGSKGWHDLPTGTSYSVADTATVDMTLTGTLISADVIAGSIGEAQLAPAVLALIKKARYL